VSDEAAFLDALAANPADDTARLVYADWLDEHGEPAKAEYLRLVVALARVETDYAREQPDVARTLALAEILPADWRAAAGSRFMLVFHSRRGTGSKFAAIRWIRALSGCGLTEAKAIVEQPISVVVPSCPIEEAVAGSELFSDENHTACIQPSELMGIPRAFTYSVTASRQNFESDDSAGEEQCIAAFVVLLTRSLSISVESARELASNYLEVNVKEGLTLFEARSLVARLKQLIPNVPADADWYLDVGVHPVAVRLTS
jgi:uncharacterized protein (TIGR02996 family)